jgi:hypothetical protein
MLVIDAKMSGVKGITVKLLEQKSSRAAVKAICDDIVKVMDAKIATIHGSGGSEMCEDLPTNFNILGYDIKDAQTLIYSELIHIYTEDKGFEHKNVGIEFCKGGKVKFHVKWLNGMTKEERDERSDVIKNHVWKHPEPKRR